MNSLLIPKILFLACALIALICLIKPEIPINSTIKWIKLMLKWHGLEGEIRATPKAKVICRVWNIVILCFFLALFMMVK